MIELIVTIAAVGVLLWAINTYIPMEAGIKKLLNIVAVVALVLWLLTKFGLLGAASNVPVPHVQAADTTLTAT